MPLSLNIFLQEYKTQYSPVPNTKCVMPTRGSPFKISLSLKTLKCSFDSIILFRRNGIHYNRIFRRHYIPQEQCSVVRQLHELVYCDYYSFVERIPFNWTATYQTKH